VIVGVMRSVLQGCELGNVSEKTWGWFHQAGVVTTPARMLDWDSSYANPWRRPQAVFAGGVSRTSIDQCFWEILRVKVVRRGLR
jgi:hypothetical protein